MLSGFGVGIGKMAVRMHDSRDGQAVDRLWIADGVSTCQAAFGLDAHQGSTSENALNGVIVDQSIGHAGNGERGDRASTHGVDIGEGVGGGDPTVELGVVDDRGEEVGGLDQCDFIGELEYTGVVCGGGANEESGVVVLRQPMQNLRECLGI